MIDKYNYGQKPCYKCGYKAYVHIVKHDILNEIYNIQCSNPNCPKTTSRNHISRHNAIIEWNSKPSIEDIFYDSIGIRIVKLIEKITKKRNKR